jgi:precorrin-6A/cobalt-precorrin-6A reductase
MLTPVLFTSDAMSAGPARILILGGTTEAARLASVLTSRPGHSVITSLAGRVAQPHLPEGLVRVGGFNGVDGLARYLREEAISVVIDATHPFACRISRNAELACESVNVPLLALERPAWTQVEGDRWTRAPNVERAAQLVCHTQQRVFLSIGRQEAGAFARCTDAWFLIRCIESPSDPLPPRSRLILDRGPFDLDSELKLLREESISILITKNSGGSATYSKIEAARQLRIEVIIIDRPVKHTIPTFSDLDALLESLSRTLEQRSILRRTRQ